MTAAVSAIHFDSESRSFVLRLKTSAYLLRILPEGAVRHVGFVPLPPEAPATLAAAHLTEYKDANFVWDWQGTPFEYPAFGDVSYREAAFKVAFTQALAELTAEEAPHVPVRDVRLRYERHEIHPDAEPLGAPAHGHPPQVATPRETLCLRLKDELGDFYVTLFYRLTPEQDLIERWVEVENRTNAPVEIETVDFGVLNLPCGHYELTRAAGAWAREFAPVTQPIEQGVFVLDQRGLNTGHAVNPFFHVCERGQATEEAGTVYFGAIAWSGNWRLRFESLPGGNCRIFAGYEASDFALTLGPGESHKTPAFLFGCSSEGRGGASRRLHRFLRERVLPGHGPEEFRPVLYNSWEATYFDLSLENQTELARVAADIGVELFVVDDGWFGARRHDRAGLGDWVVSQDVFPGGLQPLADEVRRLGMKFGLWVEPEMVNPDSDLYRAHPDWVLHFPGRPRTTSRTQMILDFGRPEVVQYLLDALDALVRENGVDFFKWDMNRYVSEPGSVAGKAIWRKHVEGLYRIWDALRRAHPHLDIQSCSGGGGRIDPGILARADQVW
ncbi:MAG TPA: alpha-galactosidase, partial [Chthoniobacterales bacterium]